MKELKYINGGEPQVGDVVLIAAFSKLRKAIILGFTNNYVVLSCSTTTRMSWKGYNISYIIHPNSLDEHDNRYYCPRYKDFYIIQRNFDIPEKLRKFVKRY